MARLSLASFFLIPFNSVWFDERIKLFTETETKWERFPSYLIQNGIKIAAAATTTTTNVGWKPAKETSIWCQNEARDFECKFCAKRLFTSPKHTLSNLTLSIRSYFYSTLMRMSTLSTDNLLLIPTSCLLDLPSQRFTAKHSKFNNTFSFHLAVCMSIYWQSSSSSSSFYSNIQQFRLILILFQCLTNFFRLPTDWLTNTSFKRPNFTIFPLRLFEKLIIESILKNFSSTTTNLKLSQIPLSCNDRRYLR